MRAASALLILAPIIACGADHDRDGLADDFEQRLLERFHPDFRIAARDCDGMPAEFPPGAHPSLSPRRNGTIYGQATRLPGGEMELHYYHLWARDCGRGGHPLDVEHVAVLLTAPAGAEREADAWTARYWYAAAHQDTVCDGAQGAPAALLDAVNRGAAVWISRGKHASYLSPDACRQGCRSDRCDSPGAPLPRGKLINVGEPGAPLHGLDWTASFRWQFLSKMRSEFPPEVRELIDRRAAASPDAAVFFLNRGLGPVQAAISGGNASLDAVATGARHTDASLETAANHTDRALNTSYRKTDDALGKSYRNTRRSLEKAHKNTLEFLGVKKKPKK